MDKESGGFAYIRQKFPKIDEAKTEEGIFFGPQIIQLLVDQDFSTKLNSIERSAWKIFEKVWRNFLGNRTAENYSASVQELIASYSAMGCNTSLKFHFLLPENTGPISDEHGESFHLGISQIEKKCSGKWSPNMLANYCWCLISETLTDENKRQKKTK